MKRYTLFVILVIIAILAIIEFRLGYSAGMRDGKKSINMDSIFKKDSLWIDSSMRVHWTKVCRDSMNKWDSINKLYER